MNRTEEISGPEALRDGGGDPAGVWAVDPVCGRKIDVTRLRIAYHHRGKKNYFCSPECLGKFLDAPDSFAEP